MGKKKRRQARKQQSRQQAKTVKKGQRPRWVGHDLLRGFVLVYMVFVNAYYVLAQDQIYGLTHDATLMGPGDVILPYFVFSLGFNLALVEYYKAHARWQLFIYGAKRAALIFSIGLLLHVYFLWEYPGNAIIFLRAPLVVLGIFLALTSLFASLSSLAREKWGFKSALWAGPVLVLLTLWATAYGLSWEGRLRFLTPWFLLTALWGLWAGRMLCSQILSLRRVFGSLAFIHLLVAFGGWAWHGYVPSRQTMDPSFFGLSLAVLAVLFYVVLNFAPSQLAATSQQNLVRKASAAIGQKLIHLGRHPLAFWIIQSICVGASVVVSTLIYTYFKWGSLAYFLSAPAIRRTIPGIALPILASLAVALIAASLALLWARFYERREESGLR